MVSVSLIRDLYTDVCDLVSQTEDDMQRLIDAFASAWTVLRLTMFKKLVVIYQSSPGKPYVEPNVFVWNNRISVVIDFVYLTRTYPLNSDVSSRIQKASNVFSTFVERLVYVKFY